jgi:hypothetical protein
MAYNPVTIKPPKIERLSVRSWEDGYNSQLDVGRTPIKGLVGATNVLLYQDGTVGPRPSLVPYGQTPPGTILGEVGEFLDSATLDKWIITVQNISGTASVVICKDAGNWLVLTGKNYDLTADCHFVQIDDKVLVMNGVDNLSFVNIPTQTVIPFVALATPLQPSIVRTGLSGSTYTYYYTITANSTVGETAAAPAASQQVSLIRGAWDTTSNYLTINWVAVAGAQSYNVYMGETADAQYLIASAVTGTSYKDDGTATKDVTRTAPIGDTTAGPKVTRGEVINGQVFLTGDTENPRYVRYGGTGSSVLDFSPYGGGGWVEIGRGTKEFPVSVKPFRTGQGTPTPMVVCKGTNGRGKRYTMQSATVTVGDEIIPYFDVKEDNGQDGTDSPDGVVVYKDQLIYPSRGGFKSTFTKAQVQSILSTDEISEKIENDIVNLNNNYMASCVGLPFENRIYWALPVGSTTNNQIWVLDLSNTRKGAWMLPLNISADWLSLYEDNSGVTRFLVLKDNQLFELSDAQATMDNMAAFPTNITSGQLRFSEDGQEWATVTRVTFVFLRPRGRINVSVSGKTEDSSLQTVGSDSFETVSTAVGWGESAWSTLQWSQTLTVPISYGNSREKIPIEIDEDMNWVTWSVDTTEANTNYQLSDVIIEYVKIGLLDSDE